MRVVATKSQKQAKAAEWGVSIQSDWGCLAGGVVRMYVYTRVCSFVSKAISAHDEMAVSFVVKASYHRLMAIMPFTLRRHILLH